MTLRTTRLTLTRPAANDVGAIYAVHSQPEAVVHNPDDGLASLEEAKELFERWDEHWRRFGFGYWVVRPRREETVLGFCGIKFLPIADRLGLNLFYRFDPQTWGSGLATEAASAVVEWALLHLPEYPIVARVRPANIASQRVAAKAGLSRAAEWDGPGHDGGFDLVFRAGGTTNDLLDQPVA